MSATVYYTRTGEATPRTWEARLFVGAEEATPGPVAMQFDAAGNRTSPAGPVTFEPVYPAGASAPLNLPLHLGATDQTAGHFTQRTLNQDGFAAGTLSNVTINHKDLSPAPFPNARPNALGNSHPPHTNQ